MTRVMGSYLEHTRRLAENTPSTRNRVADLWRAVAILGVVFGHWLAASIWQMPDGGITLRNALESVPYSGWITWVVQVMPVFFLVGGYANARAWSGGLQRGESARDWAVARARRLFTPVVPLLIVWTALIVVMRGIVPVEVVRAGAVAATSPLWFMAVYLVLTTLVPFSYRWWRSARLGSVAVLAVGAVAVDLLRFATDADWIGFANYLIVWATIHQLGYWWADRERVPPRIGAVVAAGSLALLIAVTWIGWYPVAMIGIPGAGLNNMTPPTAAIGLLGVAQAGVIWWSASPMSRLASRPKVWHAVVAWSGVILTVYVWHLTVMALMTAGGLLAFDGVAFRIEPGTAAWWLTRPLWLAVLGVVTVGFIGLFSRFEWRISREPVSTWTAVIVGGITLTAASSAAVACYGPVNSTGEIHWPVLVTALAGASLIGAFPRR